MSILILENITMKYPGAKEPCIRNLSLETGSGEITALLGASGCGKTTLLKIIAGLERPQEGSVIIEGENMRNLPSDKRPIAMVFQKPLLFENMNVEQNVNFSPRVNHTMSKTALKEKTSRMLALVGLEGFEKRRVRELSGGQEQRVSLARALMTNPRLLLLDEPLSALDANLKTTMEQTIRELNRGLHTSMIYVTHDQNEAAAVAGRIILMNDGRIVQAGTPESFYSRPENVFAAKFFGCRNIIPATQEKGIIASPLGIFDLRAARLSGKDVLLCIRPEALILSENGRFCGIVKEITPRASDRICRLECKGVTLEFVMNYGSGAAPGQQIRFDLAPHGVWCVPKEQPSGPR